MAKFNRRLVETKPEESGQTYLNCDCAGFINTVVLARWDRPESNVRTISTVFLAAPKAVETAHSGCVTMSELLMFFKDAQDTRNLVFVGEHAFKNFRLTS